MDDKIKPKSFAMQNTATALMQKRPGSKHRSDSISELDLQSVRPSQDGRGQGDASQSANRRSNGSGLLPELPANARRNNLFDP